MAEVLLTHRAARDLERLDLPTRRRILAKLRDLAADPLARARRLSDPRLGSFRYRIGDYRVVFDLEGDIVVVLRVGHRREIYS